MIDISKIRIDGGTQARAELNQSIVAEYAEAYKSGVTMPAIALFFDGSDYWLADGFHRYFAAKSAGLASIHEEVTPGSQRDAVLFSLKANETHGLRRTNADKRRAVETLLNDAEWAKFSDNEIAKRCCVSQPFVSSIRSNNGYKIEDANNGYKIDASNNGYKIEDSTRTVTRNGKTYEQNTANIGKSRSDGVSIPDQEEVKQEDAEPYNPLDDEVAGLHETIRSLADENDSLKDQLLVIDKSEAGDLAVLETISSLRREVKFLEVTIAAITTSRDTYQRENAEMKTQMTNQRKQIAKLSKAL